MTLLFSPRALQGTAEPGTCQGGGGTPRHLGAQMGSCLERAFLAVCRAPPERVKQAARPKAQN